MSVPSPKAEPFKAWLASLGKRELKDMTDPELGFDRLREIYQAKGYTDEWIKQRLQTIIALYIVGGSATMICFLWGMKNYQKALD